MKWFIFALAMLISLPALAVQPDEILDDPALEARAREVGKDLRCLVCQNQSIDDSDADLARDLRVLVRERIVAGDTNQEVIDYVVSRYGDFVLLNPPFKLKTYALWFGPAALVLFGIFAAFMFFRNKNVAAAPDGRAQSLSEAEKKKLAQLLDEDKS
ncbi:MAG: cytochrome c-type biogenesis protein CcmH [Rhodospirillales bacterium]|nr:cytochrome c-type biogenesis protein CcmH [Rhodospirillales bacterium]MBO6788173.1 cytochrome c-type biogenesis protein CcmH [Rhodospirillales bacterium]